MKIRDGFILRKVGTDYVVVAVGEASVAFRGMIKLNGTAAFIWNQIADGLNENDIVKNVLQKYDVDAETARKATQDVVSKMRQNNILKS